MGKRARWFAAAAAGVAGCLIAARPGAGQACVGDCDGDGAVSVAELIIGVNMALGNAPVDDCPAFDALADLRVTISEVIQGVANASRGCPGLEEFVAQASDFQCLTDWDKVRHFRITNDLGHLDEALAVARGEQSVPYPIGTIIQLVPAEAMVKRGGGFDPQNGDWEYFVIDPSSGETKIAQRGRQEVVNIGPPCFSCHSAARDFDFICENDHGCIDLALTEQLIDALQARDPRCP
jgi:hypothetical protein